MAKDATKIYSGPIIDVGIAAAGTADAGSFTSLGYLLEESAVEVTWEPYKAPLSDGNKPPKLGLGTAIFHLAQTDPAGAQATLETYETALAKIKFTTPNTSEYYFIDNVFVAMRLERGFKGGDVHKLSFDVSLITQHPDDFIDGPKSV